MKMARAVPTCRSLRRLFLGNAIRRRADAYSCRAERVASFDYAGHYASLRGYRSIISR